jgi:hypothetical protein
MTRSLSAVVTAVGLVLVATRGMASGPAEGRRSDVPMTRPEEALAVHEGMGGDGTFVELAEGRILMGPSSRFRTSSDGGLTWSAPWQGRDKAGRPVGRGEAGLVKLSGSAIGYVTRTRNDQGAWGVAFYRSDDEGKTWSGPVPMDAPGRYGVAMVNDCVIRTASGRIVAPVYGHMMRAPYPDRPARWLVGLRDGGLISTGAHPWPEGFFWSYVYYSDDDGRSWRSSRGGEIFLTDDDARLWGPAGEPSVAEVEPGKLLMLMRTNHGRIYKSWSLDNGETWTGALRTDLAASNAPAQIRKIPGTGDLLVVWTQQSPEEIRQGYIRARLSTAVSRTNGAVWEYFQNIESILEGTRVEPGPVHFERPEQMVYTDPLAQAPVRDPKYIVPVREDYCRCSYPSAFIYRDRLLVGHTWAHYDKDGKYTMPGRLKVVPLGWAYGGAKNMKPSPDLKKSFPIRESLAGK